MSKVDEKREYIGALKFYLSVIVAIVLAVGAGVSKLYLEKQINSLFWLGIVAIVILLCFFIYFSRKMHKEIRSLRDL